MVEKTKEYKKVRAASNGVMANIPGFHSKAGIAWFMRSKISALAGSRINIDANIDAAVDITDCFKGVTLDFNITLNRFDDRDDFGNAMYKIDTIVAEFLKLKENLILAKNDYDELMDSLKDMEIEDESYRQPATLEEVIQDSLKQAEESEKTEKESTNGPTMVH